MSRFAGFLAFLQVVIAYWYSCPITLFFHEKNVDFVEEFVVIFVK